MIYNYILLFLFYAVIGWCMEVVVSLVQRHKFINRGFMIGPYCPIYGTGTLFITLFLSKYKSDLVVFLIMTMFSCTLLEYGTGYIMEKVFHARWWDYSDKKFNLNGRVCLDTMIPFGILGIAVVYIFNPFIMKYMLLIPFIIRKILAIMLAIVFLVDLAISTKVISNLNHVKFASKDNTEEITKKVKKALNEKNLFTKRLVDAFPDFTLLIAKTKQKIVETKNEIKQKQKEIKLIRRKLRKEEKKLKKLNKNRKLWYNSHNLEEVDYEKKSLSFRIW